MKIPRADQIVSLLIMGGLIFALVPLANAQSGTEVSSSDIRAKVQDCLAKETHDERHDCMVSLKENGSGFGLGNWLRKHGRGRGAMMGLALLPDGAKEELKACKDQNVDMADRKECAKSVMEKYGIDMPPMGGMMGQMGRMGVIKHGIGECMKMGDRGEASACFLEKYDAYRKGIQSPEPQ